MSVTWDTKNLKTTPLPADEILIIDTADDRKQKRALLSSVNFWSRNTGSGFVFPSTLTDKIGIGVNTPLGKIHIQSAVAGTVSIDPDADDLILENNGNTGYTVAPIITIPDPPDPIRATGTAVLGTGVSTVTAGLPTGTGYTAGETVSLTGATSGASNARGTITVSGGIIQTITVTVIGSGYSTNEGLTIIGLTSGATDGVATASVTTQFVASITINLSGQGYAVTPTVTITDSGSGTGAAATAALVNTKVTTIIVTAGGTGYTSGTIGVSLTDVPTKQTATGTVNLSAGKVSSVTIVTPGVGYFNPPPLPTLSGGDGTGAGIDTVTLADSAVTSITVTAGGTGITLISAESQSSIFDFAHPGSPRHARFIFNHSTERFRLINNGVQGFIVDTNANVAITASDANFTEKFTVDSVILNNPVRISIQDSIERLKLGYSGSDALNLTGIPAQVIVPTNTANLIIASGGASASNVLFYTSAGSTILERMRITNAGRIGIGETDPDNVLHIGNNAGDFHIGGKNNVVDNRLIIDNSGNIKHTFGLNDGSSAPVPGRFQIIANVNNNLEANNDSGGIYLRAGTKRWGAIASNNIATTGSAAGSLRFFVGGTSTNQNYDSLSAILGMVLNTDGTLSVTKNILTSAGTLALPSHSFIDDPTTGIHQPSSGLPLASTNFTSVIDSVSNPGTARFVHPGTSPSPQLGADVRITAVSGAYDEKEGKVTARTATTFEIAGINFTVTTTGTFTSNAAFSLVAGTKEIIRVISETGTDSHIRIKSHFDSSMMISSESPSGNSVLQLNSKGTGTLILNGDVDSAQVNIGRADSSNQYPLEVGINGSISVGHSNSPPTSTTGEVAGFRGPTTFTQTQIVVRSPTNAHQLDMGVVDTDLVFIKSRSGNQIAFSTNSGEVIRISNLNVGIGVVTPLAKLNVLSTTEQLRLSYDVTNYSSFTVNSTGDLIVTPTGNNIQFKNAVDSVTGFQIFDTDGGTPIFNVDTTNERVGIGVAAPLAALDVLSTTEQLRLSFSASVFASFTVNSTGDLAVTPTGNNVQFKNAVDSVTGFQIFDTDGGTPIFNVDTTNERVGIRIAAPDTSLHILGPTSNLGADIAKFGNAADTDQITITDQTTTNSLPPMIEGLPAFGLGLAASNAAGLMIFYTGGKTTSEERMRITSTGNVGIGLTVPAAKLHVNGAGIFAGNLSAFGDLTIFGNIIASVNITVTGRIIVSVTAGITANPGGGQTNAVLLTKTINQVSTVALALDSVKLPVAAAGEEITVINNGAQILAVFPNTGDKIDALLINEEFNVSPASRFIFKSYNTTNWVTF